MLYHHLPLAQIIFHPNQIAKISVINPNFGNAGPTTASNHGRDMNFIGSFDYYALSLKLTL